jgi:hypothetical protein
MRYSIARALDQARRLVDKLVLVRDEGEQHADRHLAGQCRLRADIDNQGIFQAEDRFIGDVECLLQKAGRRLGPRDLGIAVHPHRTALGFGVKILMLCTARIVSIKVVLFRLLASISSSVPRRIR